MTKPEEYLPPPGQIKMVSDIVSSEKPGAAALLNLGYVGAGSEELLKKEVSLGAGSRIPGKTPVTGITMQMSSGRGNELVNADIQGLIFQGDMYDDQIRKDIRSNVVRVRQDLADLKTGKINSRIRDKLERGANIDVNDWDNLRFTNRSIAQKFKTEAIELQSLILRGEQNIQDIPGLLGRATKLLTQDVFKTDRQYTSIGASGARETYLNLPILPFSQRNSIDTEVRISNTGDEIILGSKNTSDRATVQVKVGEGTKELELLKYRLKNHKFLISDTASSTLYDAFGGFDLDDKVISDLSFLTDTSGTRRLASFVWRQPTGPQEFALMFPHLDEDTITRMLGSETQFSEKFKILSGAISDSISEERFGRIPTAKIGVTATELTRLTEEEKIIKYVSLLSNGQAASAKRYIEGMDRNNPQFFEKIEKAIFRILDVGQDVNGANLGLELEGSGSIGIDKILRHLPGSNEMLTDDYRFINLPQINNRVVEMASRGRFGTPLAMTAEEAASLAANDSAFAVQYRRSNFIQMFESKAVIGEDEQVVNAVRNIIRNNPIDFEGQDVNTIFTSTRDRVVNKVGSSRAVNDTEVAYRIAGQILDKKNSYSQELQDQIQETVNKAFNRRQFELFGSDDKLGIYVNKLGFASSLDQQTEDAVNGLMQKAGSNTKVLDRLRLLRLSTTPIYNPEQAIDAALTGGGKRIITGSVEELFDAARIFAGTSEYDPVTLRAALIEGIASLGVAKENFTDEAIEQVLRVANPGLTSTQISAGRVAARNNVHEFIQSMLDNSNAEVRKLALGFIDSGADAVGTAAITRASRNIGEIFAYQQAFEMNAEEIIGFDKFATELKLSVSKSGGTPDVITVARGFLQGYDSAQGNMDGRAMPATADNVYNKISALLREHDLDPEKFNRKKLNSIKQILINEIPAADTTFGLTKDVDALALEISSNKANQIRLKQQATANIEKIRAVLGEGPDVQSVNSFTASMLEDSGRSLRSVSELDSILNSLTGVKSLYNFSPQDQNLVRKIESFYPGIREALEENEPISKLALDEFTNMATATIAKERAALTRSLTGFIDQSVVDNPDNPAALVNRVQALLFKKAEYASYATDDPAQRGLSKLIELALDPDGELASRNYTISGQNYAFSDIVEFARAKTLKDLFEQQIGSAGRAEIDNVIGYIESTKLTSLAGQDAFGQKTIESLGYQQAKSVVRSELDNLIRVPETMQQMPPELERALSTIEPAAMTSIRESFARGDSPSPGRLSLGLKGLEDVVNPAIDNNLINDMLTLAAEKQERAEELVASSYRNRLRSNVPIEQLSDEAVEQSTQAYLNRLRQLIALRRAQDGYELMRIQNPALASAVEEAGDTPVVNSIDSLLEQSMRELGQLESTDEAMRRSLGEAIADEVTPTKYTRVGDYLKRSINSNPQAASAFQTLGQNKGKVLAGAATAAGLAIFAFRRKGDRTEGDLTGPPLLPGGNPYENLPTAASQAPQAPMAQGRAGTSYSVSVNASEDQMNELMQRAAYLSNGQIQGTMHNSLPDLGRNSYEDIAGSF